MRNILISAGAWAALLSVNASEAVEVAVTMDDPTTEETPLLTPLERDRAILKALDHAGVRAVLFVSGKNVDSSVGREILAAWDQRGHWLANHTYSHANLNSPSQDVRSYGDDILRAETLLSPYANFKKLFRFPYLKEGDTAAKRDAVRAFLKKNGYAHGHVTIDASDWYIDARLRERLKEQPNADLRGYKEYYLKHMWDRARYYDRLARQAVDRPVKHTLLIHHNLLNALFLGDLITHFKEKGWKVVAPEIVFKDDIYKREPKIAPAGESVIWALAKETGRFSNSLRYPGEDARYERQEMERRGL